MRRLWSAFMILFCFGNALQGSDVLFEDQFKAKLGAGWSWIREHPQAWRTTEHGLGLEVLIEPGNMWGPQNDAKNLLTRPAPNASGAEIEVSVQVENKPTHQYEQVDLVWYYSDGNMVKLGQELVDGKLSVVMGREENDKTRTVSITPLDSTEVGLRMFARNNQIRGQFRTPQGIWRDVGECDMPALSGVSPRISLQFYQGSETERHWARITNFRIRKILHFWCKGTTNWPSRRTTSRIILRPGRITWNKQPF